MAEDVQKGDFLACFRGRGVAEKEYKSANRKHSRQFRGTCFNLSFDGEGGGVDSIQLKKKIFSQPKLDIFRCV